MSNVQTLAALEHHDAFVARHIGPNDAEIATMLEVIGHPSLDAMTDAIVPGKIRLSEPLNLPDSMTEVDALGLGMEAARRYCKDVLPCMNEVRRHADMLETRVADDLWALPNYQEILFGK